MRGKPYLVMAVAFLVAALVLSLGVDSGPRMEAYVDVTATLFTLSEDTETTRWQRESGEQVRIEAFRDWNPNNRDLEAREDIRSDANGVAHAVLEIGRPGEYHVWITWGEESHGRIIDISEEDDGETFYIDVELREGMGAF